MLNCTSVKSGKSCLFMKKNGCSFNGGSCHAVTDACAGCSHIETFPGGEYCEIFAEPAVRWINGLCNMASHALNGDEDSGDKKKLNPLKASKRSRS